MNILMDELPYNVNIAGHTVPINTDYRTGIYFEQCLADETLDDDTKLNEVLLLYFGESIGPLLTVLMKMCWLILKALVPGKKNRRFHTNMTAAIFIQRFLKHTI